jgi:hypothetical protein
VVFFGEIHNAAAVIQGLQVSIGSRQIEEKNKKENVPVSSRFSSPQSDSKPAESFHSRPLQKKSTRYKMDKQKKKKKKKKKNE